MPEIKDCIHERTFLKIYQDLVKGECSAPRGLQIIELTNYSYTLEPYVRFPNFAARKLNVGYVKNELLWYLKGDRYDSSITKYAKMWGEVMNPDGSINSNYGQYIFGKENQFDRVVSELTVDKDSRRAVIVILSNKHFESKNDVPCTYAMSFRIRNERLEMTVRMRSQDAVLGLGSDCPIFSIIHEMMYWKLKDAYPNLEYGNYVHSADSFHVYEKHYEMLNAILTNPEFTLVICPKISGSAEVEFVRRLDFTVIPSEYLFTRWLASV